MYKDEIEYALKNLRNLADAIRKFGLEESAEALLENVEILKRNSVDWEKAEK